jgi:hypothetical protein
MVGSDVPEEFHLTMLPSLSLASRSHPENSPAEAVEQQAALQMSLHKQKKEDVRRC